MKVQQESRVFLPTAIRAAEISRKDISPQIWDSCAKQCNASFRCSYAATAAWRFDHSFMPARLRYFDLYSEDSGSKIGQCAIARGRQQTIFLDGLQLLPEHEELWQPAMEALLSVLGPGRYRYGSRWSMEKARDLDFTKIRDVTVERAKPIIVQAVDFSHWNSWDDYYRQVSNNARRSAKKAVVRHPDLQLKVRRGLSTLFDSPSLTMLQRAVARRKQISASFLRMAARFLFRTITMHKYAVTAVVTAEGRTLAAFSGIEFGENTYYLSGGSEAEIGGAAWHLMLALIRETHDRTHGSGKFLMGSVEENSPGWISLARSREQCRVVDFPTSIVTFTYC